VGKLEHARLLLVEGDGPGIFKYAFETEKLEKLERLDTLDEALSKAFDVLNWDDKKIIMGDLLAAWELADEAFRMVLSNEEGRARAPAARRSSN
jgi:hypothetical protein